MSSGSGPVMKALDRWQEAGLVGPELAERLRQDVVRHAEVGAMRLGQLVLAATAAVVLVMAGGVFINWAWHLVGEGGRAALLGVAGLGVHVAGIPLERRRRWLPAAWLMQVGGLGLLMSAVIYSERAWPDGTRGGITAGIIALLLPLLLAPRTLGKGPVMPAVHVAFALGFLVVFMDRATPLEASAIVWVMDAAVLVTLLEVLRILRKDPTEPRHSWALYGFVVAVYAAGVFTVATAAEALHMDELAAYPLDVWLLIVAAVTLWGVHRAPRDLWRPWFEDHLAFCVLLAFPLTMFTALGAMKRGPGTALALLAPVAVAGFAYATAYRVPRMMLASALVFVLGTWSWAVAKGGALGAVAALAFTSALLFWLSGRLGQLRAAGPPEVPLE